MDEEGEVVTESGLAQVAAQLEQSLHWSLDAVRQAKLLLDPNCTHGSRVALQGWLALSPGIELQESTSPTPPCIFRDNRMRLVFHLPSPIVGNCEGTPAQQTMRRLQLLSYGGMKESGKLLPPGLARSLPGTDAVAMQLNDQCHVWLGPNAPLQQVTIIFPSCAGAWPMSFFLEDEESTLMLFVELKHIVAADGKPPSTDSFTKAMYAAALAAVRSDIAAATLNGPILEGAPGTRKCIIPATRLYINAEARQLQRPPPDWSVRLSTSGAEQVGQLWLEQQGGHPLQVVFRGERNTQSYFPGWPSLGGICTTRSACSVWHVGRTSTPLPCLMPVQCLRSPTIRRPHGSR